MSTTMEHLHQDILDIKQEITFIRNILAEDFELTDEAKKSLFEARKTPKKEYVSHEDVKKSLLK